MWTPVGYKQETSLSAAVGLRYQSGNITDATNASPIVITSASHGLSSGDVVKIEAVGGNTNANGRRTVTVVDANSFSLDNVAGNAAYTSGGTWRKVPNGARFVLLQAESQNIRWRDDGTDPTASVGMLLTAGASPFMYLGDMLAIKFIEVTGSAKLNATFHQ